MSGTRYRRGGLYAADMTVYARALSEENTNGETLQRLKRNLLYYVEGLNMKQIGERTGVDKSTVSRTIRRGEEQLRRCLRFGAANLLDQAGVKTPYHSVRNLAKREGYENC